MNFLQTIRMEYNALFGCLKKTQKLDIVISGLKVLENEGLSCKVFEN